MNAYERAGRMTKVARVVGFLAGNPDFDGDVDTLRQLPERGWALVARAAGVQPMSVATRNLVIASFVPTDSTTDVFAGLA